METTARLALPYAEPSDPLADLDNITQALAERLDLLHGETGVENIGATTVDTTRSVRVNYARSYATAPIPRVLVQTNDEYANSNVFRVWVTGEDATGFTLNVRASNLVVRPVRWVARPV